MLVTNFASGELSKYLFGRIDLPQYYGGAAHIENFDIIPTGGVRRRSGTRRLAELEASGRLFPLVINRTENYLLYFTHEKITVFRAGEWDAPVKTFTNEDLEPPHSLYAENELYDIQTAQNQGKIVAAHAEHAPLEINLEGEITVKVLDIKIKIKQEHAPELESSFPEEEDKYYAENRYLLRNGRYPAAVTFFNGRLVFAGTKEDRQRLFFSAVYDYGDFSTYRSFVTEVKNYAIVRGKVTNGSNIIRLADNLEAEKIISPETSVYRFESRFFPEGAVLSVYPRTVEDENGNRQILMEASAPAYGIIGGLPEEVEEELDRKVGEFEAANNNKTQYNRVGDVNFISDNNSVYNIICVQTGADEINILSMISHTWLEICKGPVTYKLPYKIGEDLDTEQRDLAQLIRQYIDLYVAANYPAGAYFTGSYAWTSIQSVADAWRPLVIEHNRYENENLPDNPYYGTMPEIRDRIKNAAAFSDVYIPLYTVEQKKDDHPTADCGFMFEIASGANDAIRWLAGNRGIIIGTELSEWFVPPDVNPTDTRAVKCSGYGCDGIQGEGVGEATVFLQTGRRKLVEYYPNENNHFRANDMAMLAPQMLHESPAREFDCAASPYTKLFITREDGVMATLLYERGTGTFAWSRITTGEVKRDAAAGGDAEKARAAHHNRKLTYELSPGPFNMPKTPERTVEGRIKSAAVLPGESGFDEVYLAVERNGRTFLELLREDCGVYLDSWSEFDGGDRTGYTDDAVAHGGKIGYPYSSILRSMPVQANQMMKKTNVKNLNIRFCDSHMPSFRALPQGAANEIEKPEPYSGVARSYFPGGWDKNLQFELFTDKPAGCTVLAVYAEAE